MSWKDDKDLGAWPFTEQPDKWGYLNNPRWSNHPKGAADSMSASEFCEKKGIALDPIHTHKPCGHWHKNPALTVTSYESIAGWWWQPSVDVRDGIIGLVPQRYDNEATDGIIGLVYDVETETWASRGEVLDIAIIYGIPNTCRVAEDYMAYYCTCYDGHPWDTNLMYGRIYIFKEGEDPRYTDVWATNYTTGTPYEIWASKVYNVMDCVGDRIACAAFVDQIDGAVTRKWQIKISNDAGLTFPVEYLFDLRESTNDNVQIRMTSDGIVWALYLRVDYATTQQIELWKSNAGATDFSKIWDHSYYADTGHKYPHISLSMSEDGQYITIALMNDSPDEYVVVYSSADFGENFDTYTHAIDPYELMVSNGQYVIVPADEVFKRSVDYGENFDDIDPTPIVISNSWPDLQCYDNEFVYLECGEGFGGDLEFQGIVYSDDNGATWSVIKSPAANTEDPDAGYEEIIGGTETIKEPQVWSLPTGGHSL